MRLRTGLAAAMVAGVVLAACGGDDDDDVGGDTTTEAPAASTAPAPSVARTAAPDDGATASAPAAAGDCSLDEPLTIGYAADFSDLGGFADVPGSEAAEVQVDLLNEAGGVGGQQIAYVVKELPGDPSAAQRAAQELLDDGVDAIIGPPFAYNGVPLIDTVDGQVPVISNASDDPALVDPLCGAFLMSFSDPVQAAAAAQFTTEDGATTAVTFSSPDDPYFTNTTAAFTDAFEHGGGEVLQDFTFSLADEDFSAQVNELAQLDTPPDVLYTAMVMPGAGVLLEQLAAAGLADIHVIGADGSTPPSCGAPATSPTASRSPATRSLARATACRRSSTPPTPPASRSTPSASAPSRPTSSRCSRRPPSKRARSTARR